MIHLRAPAKLNLYLRVVGPRSDGYHEIETVFERVDLADELTFQLHPTDIRLTCTGGDLPSGEDNLVVKAARLLRQAGGGRRGAEMHLIKRIPIAAGLGGGSSDAAAALSGLNELWGLGLSRPALLELAAQLGSDVPFFLSDAPFAIGRGRGEVCEPFAEAAPLFHVLVVPDAQLSTRQVYEGFDQRAQLDFSTRPLALLGIVPSKRSESSHLTALTPSISMVEHALRNGSLSELAKGLWNDLEPEAIRRCPAISLIQLELQRLGCLAACVSGSGPSVFGLCRDGAHAEELAERLRRSAKQPWRVEVLNTQR